MTAPQASPRRSRWSSRVTSIRLCPSAPCHRQRRGRAGEKGEAEQDRAREKQAEKGRLGGTEGEGGTAIHVLFVEGRFFLCWKFPPAVP